MQPECKQCGAPLSSDALEGLCPKCLLQAGFATEGSRTRVGTTSTSGPGSRKVDESASGEAATGVCPVEGLKELFPQLEILELLGKGGMGAVYKARQPALDRLVALKILPKPTGPDPGFAERFTREARALARLSHPNIVAVYDFGQARRRHYFIIEFVDGLNLRQLEAAGRLSAREALQIIPQICEALQFAHDEGVVHRDIKPENVLVDKKGRVKIADFGLAKILDADAKEMRLTGARDVMGTPHYMAPEQVEHPQTVDHRADIYSLGVVFYEMLTGELPLGKFAPPSRKVQVDVRLDEVVLHALEKEPERRYQHASEVKTDVETIASGNSSVSVSLEEPARAGTQFWSRAVGAAGVAVAVLLIFAAFVFVNRSRGTRALPELAGASGPKGEERPLAETPWLAPDALVQCTVLDLQPNGEARFTNTMVVLNETEETWTTYGFVDSEANDTERIEDALARPVVFDTRYEDGVLRLAVTLNQPVPPGQRLTLRSIGVGAGGAVPTDEPGVFGYSSRHWPAAGRHTRRLELHRLPRGARLLEKQPRDLHESIRNGRIELYIDRLIPPGDSLEVVYRYQLNQK